jgi:hypothetical protein
MSMTLMPLVKPGQMLPSGPPATQSSGAPPCPASATYSRPLGAKSRSRGLSRPETITVKPLVDCAAAGATTPTASSATAPAVVASPPTIAVLRMRPSPASSVIVSMTDDGQARTGPGPPSYKPGLGDRLRRSVLLIHPLGDRNRHARIRPPPGRSGQASATRGAVEGSVAVILATAGMYRPARSCRHDQVSPACAPGARCVIAGVIRRKGGSRRWCRVANAGRLVRWRPVALSGPKAGGAVSSADQLAYKSSQPAERPPPDVVIGSTRVNGCPRPSRSESLRLNTADPTRACWL